MISWLFTRASRVLRRTPLRRIDALNRLHSWLYGLLAKKPLVDFRGFILEVDPRDRLIAKKIALYGGFEEYLGDLLIALSKPGSVVVDIGANIGIHTLPLAHSVGHDGRIVAFEPDPDNYVILQRNIQRNQLANVQVHQVAVSSQTGEAQLYQDAINRGALSLNANNVKCDARRPGSVAVKTVSADDLLTAYDNRISLIKIDIEGAEPLALAGLEKTLAANPDVVLVFEFVPRYIRHFGFDPGELLSGLESRGFCLGVIDEAARRVNLLDSNELLALAESTANDLNVIASRQPLRNRLQDGTYTT